MSIFRKSPAKLLGNLKEIFAELAQLDKIPANKENLELMIEITVKKIEVLRKLENNISEIERSKDKFHKFIESKLQGESLAKFDNMYQEIAKMLYFKDPELGKNTLRQSYIFNLKDYQRLQEEQNTYIKQKGIKKVNESNVVYLNKSFHKLGKMMCTFLILGAVINVAQVPPSYAGGAKITSLQMMSNSAFDEMNAFDSDFETSNRSKSNSAFDEMNNSKTGFSGDSQNYKEVAEAEFSPEVLKFLSTVQMPIYQQLLRGTNGHLSKTVVDNYRKNNPYYLQNTNMLQAQVNSALHNAVSIAYQRGDTSQSNILKILQQILV